MYSEIELLLGGQQFKQLYEKEYGFIMEKYGLRKIEIDMIYFMYRNNNTCTAKEIVNYNHISKAHISKAMDNLNNLGYISISHDIKDHRICKMSLKESTKDVVEEIIEVRKHIYQVLLNGISNEELEIVKNITRKIINNIDAEIKK